MVFLEFKQDPENVQDVIENYHKNQKFLTQKRKGNQPLETSPNWTVLELKDRDLKQLLKQFVHWKQIKR